MSKGLSGLFADTKGARAAVVALAVKRVVKTTAANASKRAMADAVNQWARAKVDELAAESNGKRRAFNTACIAFDEESGQYFYGRNKGIELSGAAKNPELFGEGGILPKEKIGGYSIGNCAEVDAVNSALNAGAKLKNLTLLTIHSYEADFGKPKVACENCTYAFKGKIKYNHSGWKEV